MASCQGIRSRAQAVCIAVRLGWITTCSAPRTLHHQRPHPVKVGVPGRQHHHPLDCGQGRELFQGPFRVLAQGNFHGPVLRKVVQETPPPHQHLGLPDDLPGPWGQVRRVTSPGPPPAPESWRHLPGALPPPEGRAVKIEHHRAELRPRPGIVSQGRQHPGAHLGHHAARPRLR